MKNIALLILVLLSLILGIDCFRSRTQQALDNDRHTAEMSLLRGEVARLRTVLEEKNRQDSPTHHRGIDPVFKKQPDPTPTSSAVSADWPPEINEVASPFPGTVAWKAKEAVSDIQKHLSLTTEQTKMLAERFGAVFADQGGTLGGPRFLISRNEILEELIGKEQTEALKKRELEQLQRQFDERVNTETIVLARKLGLSADQEAVLRSALQATERQLAPERQRVNGKMREMMGLHFAGKEGQAELQKGYDEIEALNRTIKEQRDSAILAAVGPNLTDEQRNLLLEQQSTQPGE